MNGDPRDSLLLCAQMSESVASPSGLFGEIRALSEGRPRRVRNRCLAVLPALAVLARPVSASPFEDLTNGGAVFTGPVHAHPTSILVNPAALGIGGIQQYAYLGVSGRIDQFSIQRQRTVGEDTGTGAPVLEPGPSISPTTWAPGGLLSVQIKAGNSAVLVGALSLPLYESFISEQEDLGYHVLAGEHRRWSGSVGTAVRVSDNFYVGASLSGTSTALNLSFYRDTALEAGRDLADGGILSDCGGAPCGIENAMAAERWDVAVASEGFIGAQTLSIRAGVAYQFLKGWWAGASYHSPPGLQAPVSLRGSVTIERAAIDPQGPETLTRDAEITYKLPQTVYLGVRGPITDGVEVLAHMRWQNLSRQRLFDLRVFGRDETPADIPEWYQRYRGLRDVVSLEAGVETTGVRRWLFGGRMRVERGATDSASTAPMQVAGFNVSGALGTQLRISQNVVMALSGGFSWLPTVTVDDSDYDPLERLTCIENFDLDNCASTVEGRAIASAAGTYQRFTVALRTSLRVYWD